MVWYLTKGNVFLPNESHFTVPVDAESADSFEFLMEAIQCLIDYEQNYHGVNPHALKKVKQELKDAENDEKMKMMLGEDKVTMKMLMEERMKNAYIEKQKDRLAEEVAKRIDESLYKLQRGEKTMEATFEELHKIKKLAATVGVLDDMEETAFKKALMDCQSPQESVQFMNYIGEFNAIGRKFKEMKSNSGLLAPEHYPALQIMWIQMSKLKEHIFLNCKKDHVQKLVLTVLYQRYSEGRLPTGFQYTFDAGYDIKEWEEKAMRTNSLKAMKEVIDLYKQNDNYDPKPFVYLEILEQMKKAAFDPATK